MLTPDGIQELRDKGRYETAEVMEAKRNDLIAESKANSATKTSSRALADSAANTYFEPNEYEKGIIGRAYDPVYDHHETVTGGNSFDAQYADLNLYYTGEVASARIKTMDFKQEYTKARQLAEKYLLQNNPDGARAVMSPWVAAKSRIQAEKIASEANASTEETYALLNNWESGNRADIIEQSAAAFGGTSTYDAQNPTHRILAAQYHRTQRYLESKEVETVRIYSSSNANRTGLGSYTLEEEVARVESPERNAYFTDVPASRILSLPQTGMGSVAAREIIISGKENMGWKSTTFTVDNPNGQPGGYHQ